MIPKIIHYCWLSSDPYPNDLVQYMKTWNEKLPDFEFKLWNFDCFDINSSLWVKQAFENKKYAFAADYIRLYAVYNYGGFYLDMDMEVVKSFNDLLDKSIVLAYEDDDKTGIEAGCFGAEKGNDLIKECLSYYNNREFIKDDGTFDTLPLPKIMKKYTDLYSNLDIKTRDYFTCKSIGTGIISKTENSYTVHNFAGSWLPMKRRNMIEMKNSLLAKYRGNLFVIVFVRLINMMIRIEDEGFFSAISFYVKRLFKIW